MNSLPRRAGLERGTNETKISVSLNLDGTGAAHIATGIGFFDHMLAQTAKHGFFDLEVQAEGDLQVDGHHTVEDVGIVMGKALAAALGGREGIARYGCEILPMEDALVLCALDVSGRPFLAFGSRACGSRELPEAPLSGGVFTVPKIGGMDTELVEEFFRALCLHGGLNLHIQVLAGKNNHHVAEAIFKAFGRALDKATAADPRVVGALSTKGVL
jgi:imidazoleglycerol-phosphate dehydratase